MTRDRVVQFRVNAGERERLGALAAGAGVKLSDWVRSRALGEASGDPVVQRVGAVPAGSGGDLSVSASPRASRQQLTQRVPGLKPARQFVKPFNPRPKGS